MTTLRMPFRLTPAASWGQPAQAWSKAALVIAALVAVHQGKAWVARMARPKLTHWIEGLSSSFTFQDLAIPWASLLYSLTTLSIACLFLRALGIRVQWDGFIRRSWQGILESTGLAASAALAAWIGMIALGSVAVSRNPEFTKIGFVISFQWVLAQSALEEVWVRGLYFNALREAFDDSWALWIQALGFGALHFVSAGDLKAVAGPAYVLLGISTALLGLACGWAVLRWGNLWAPIAIHFVWNWVTSSLTGLPCSGSVPMPGPFLSKVVGEIRWLNGSVIGVEGSVLGVLALLALTVWLWIKAPAQAREVI